MNYVDIARSICVAAHGGQVDKGGQLYFLHPFFIAEQMDNDDARIVAYLHDVFEDTDMKINSLSSIGFSNDVIDALHAITKREDETYENYIQRVKRNDLACEVKKADLEHNMDLSRLTYVLDSDKKRVEKYKKALACLIE